MKAKQEKPKLCMVTGCQRTIRSRGLCDLHYTYLALKVKRGKYTWDQLVESGVCLASARINAGQNGVGMATFLKEKGLE